MYKIYLTYMLVKWPECWYIWIWCLVNKEHLNIIFHDLYISNPLIGMLSPIADEEHLDNNHRDGQANKDKHTNKKSYVILRKVVSNGKNHFTKFTNWTTWEIVN